MNNERTEALRYEKTALLAELDADQSARHMTDADRREARARVREINLQLGRA